MTEDVREKLNPKRWVLFGSVVSIAALLQAAVITNTSAMAIPSNTTRHNTE